MSRDEDVWAPRGSATEFGGPLSLEQAAILSLLDRVEALEREVRRLSRLVDRSRGGGRLAG